MGHGGELIQLLLVLAAAALGAAAFERMRLPAVAGFLITGALVGPGGLGLVREPERVQALAELGVALLLFEIGLELPLEELRGRWRAALVSGALQVGLTLAAATALGLSLGVGTETAVLVGMLVAMSSTALVMRVLAQLDEVDAPHGRHALGILLFQDLCVIPFLLAIPLLSGAVPRDPLPLALAVVQALAALVGLFTAARFVLPWTLERAARLRSAELFSLVALLLALGSAVLAERIGLSLAVGAFIAGLVVNASPYARQLFAEVAPLRGVLLGVFFTAVGMLLVPAQALDAWLEVLGFVSGVVVLKAAVVFAVIAGAMRAGTGTALRTALALAQTGEFSFVLVVAGAEAGVVDPRLEQVFVASAVLTLVATPFLIRASGPLARRLGDVVPLSDAAPAVASGHVLVIGFGLAGRTLLRVLGSARIPCQVVDVNAARVAEGRRRGEPVLFGDATRPALLERLGLRRARLLCVAINDPGSTRAIVQVAREMAPDLPILVRTRYVADVDRLQQLGATDVVVEELESTLDLMSEVLRRFSLSQTAIARFAEQMRDEGYALLRAPVGLALDPWLAEALREVPAQWVQVPDSAPPGRSIGELDVRARTGASVLAVQRDGVVHANPPAVFRVEPGDAVLVLLGPAGAAAVEALLAGGAPGPG
jgi:CPA2 family monovalent cation:H+ antiporter-2